MVNCTIDYLQHPLDRSTSTQTTFGVLLIISTHVVVHAAQIHTTYPRRFLHDISNVHHPELLKEVQEGLIKVFTAMLWRCDEK